MSLRSILILLATFSTVVASERFHLYTIFSSPTLTQRLSGFFNEVMRQIPSKKFNKVAQAIIKHEAQPISDKQFYKKLMKKVPSIQPAIPLVRKVQALRHQKAILGAQIKKLISGTKKINGILEIGSPGTYASTISSWAQLTGPLYTALDEKKLTDIIQSTLSKKFIPLNNFEPLSSKIPDGSLDLVICFIGLHHTPIEKLDAFVASIRRVLRPGGILLLRDHDAYDEAMQSIVHAAHTTFNLIIAGEPLDRELAEYRHFQPLTYWINLLEKHGFEMGSERLLQKNDPTLNTMMKCIKKTQTDHEYVARISHELAQQPDYLRDGMQTYLTAPEWLNVDVAQKYGKFIEHTPFYEFPNLAAVRAYWSVFGKSWKQAARQRGHVAVATSPYTLMNLFVGATMSMEYGARALISAPLRALYSGQEAGKIQLLIDDAEREIKKIDPRIRVLKKYQPGTLKLIEMPRYKQFTDIIKKMAASSITIKEIAGQTEIMIKVRSNDKIPDGTIAMTWKLPTDTATYYGVVIKVGELNHFITTCTDRGIDILYVHDF